MRESCVAKARAYFGKDFHRVLEWYLEFGYVYSGKELFVLACIHNKEQILSRKPNKELDKLDCWYIQYVSGDIKRLFEIVPEEKEWAIFERAGKKPKIYKTADIKRRFNYGKPEITRCAAASTSSCNGN